MTSDVQDQLKLYSKCLFHLIFTFHVSNSVRRTFPQTTNPTNPTKIQVSTFFSCLNRISGCWIFTACRHMRDIFQTDTYTKVSVQKGGKPMMYAAITASSRCSGALECNRRISSLSSSPAFCLRSHRAPPPSLLQRGKDRNRADCNLPQWNAFVQYTKKRERKQ